MLLPGLLLVVLGYLVVAPLVRLQLAAFADGAAGYRAALSSPRLGTVLATTAMLGLGSLLIALAMGTFLAWMSMQLPPRVAWMSVLPMLPIVIPPVAFVMGWVLWLAPRAGLGNRALRSLPLFGSQDPTATGPIDIFTPEWVTIITGLYLTAFVYIFVRAGMTRINNELIEAARSSGASPFRVFFGTTLPLIRPSDPAGTRCSGMPR
jgi:iron(III) transport system permease protein